MFAANDKFFASGTFLKVNGFTVGMTFMYMQGV